MAAPDMEVIKDIPGYKVILKAVLKNQIQQLVEQLASTTEEESVILTASVADGTLCHLGSNSGRVFLEDHEDIKSQFLGFCLKRHHKEKQEKEKQEALEREEALARSMQAVPPPRYDGVGNRMSFIPHRPPRYLPPHQSLHPVSIVRAGGRMRSPANRHQPYSMIRPPRVSPSSDQQGRSPGQSQRPGPSMNKGRLPVSNKVDGQQVIKIEPKDDNEDNSNQSVNDSARIPIPTDAITDSSLPPSPSIKPLTPSQSQGSSASNNDDDNLESSTTDIPNESSELGFSDSAPPGGLGLDSDLSNILSMSSSTTDSNVQQSTSAEGLTNEPHNTSTELDPNVSVKLESPVDDSEMDLEITGVELGHRQPVQEPMSSQDWMANVQNVMQGATGSPADMAGQQGYIFKDKPVQVIQTYDAVSADGPVIMRTICRTCGKMLQSGSALRIHMRIHTGEKPHVCPICGKAWAQKSNLNQHLKFVHQQHQPNS